MEEIAEESEWPTTYIVFTKTTEFPGGGGAYPDFRG